jgi:hypothetical protein
MSANTRLILNYFFNPAVVGGADLQDTRASASRRFGEKGYKDCFAL